MSSHAGRLYRSMFPRSYYGYISKRTLSRVAKQTPRSSAYLSPYSVAPCLGSINHYYHFIFDLLLPLDVIYRQNPDARLYLKEFGVLTPALKDVFEQITIVGEQPANTPRMPLWTMNPKCVKISRQAVLDLKETVFSQLRIQANRHPHKVILIERAPAHQSFLVQGNAGKGRRSIANLDALEGAIGAVLKPGLELNRVQLENMSLKEQVQLFADSVAVIGRHGAGLANMLWMNQGSGVIEIGIEHRKHFSIISNLCKHRFNVVNFDQPHAHVDPEEFIAWLSGLPGLKQILA